MKTLNWEKHFDSHAIFSALSAEGKAELLSDEISEEKKYEPESIVIAKGDPSRDIYLIGSGVASVCLPGTAGESVPINQLVAGDFFGEIALIENKPRTATIVAKEELVVLRINGFAFLERLKNNSDLEFRILLILSERLRSLTQMYAVDVKQLDEKLSFFKHQFSSTLTSVEANQKSAENSVDAKLQAADVVFQETKERVREVIDDAQRNRTRTIAFGSVVSTILAGVLTVGAYLGINKMDGIATIHDEATQLFEETRDFREGFQKTRESINALHLEAEEKVAQMRRDRFVLYHMLMITPNNDDSLFETIVLKNSGGAGQDIYNEALESLNSADDGYVYKIIEKNLSRGGCTEYGSTLRNRYIDLMTKGLEQGYADSDLEKALSYYYILGAALLEENGSLYKSVYPEFKEFAKSARKQDLFNHDPFWISIPFLSDSNACVPAYKNIAYSTLKNDVFCVLQDPEKEIYRKLCS